MAEIFHWSADTGVEWFGRENPKRREQRLREEAQRARTSAIAAQEAQRTEELRARAAKARKRRQRLRRLWGKRMAPILEAVAPLMGISFSDEKKLDKLSKQIRQAAREQKTSVEAIGNQLIAERTPAEPQGTVMGQGGLMPFVLLGGLIAIGGALWMTTAK